jgi:hypothetical protein
LALQPVLLESEHHIFSLYSGGPSMLVELEEFTGIKIWINPVHVQRLMADPHSKGLTNIHVTNGSSISVTGDIGKVAKLLNEGLKC